MFFRYVGMRRKAIDLDNTFKGSCFLVGGGYQLAQEKERLNDPRIVTMAMNNAATQFLPTLWAGADTTEHYSESILTNPNIMKFLYVTRKDGPVLNWRARDMSNMYFTVGLACEPKECFLRGRDFGWWKNVFMYSIQLLHRLGFSRVYTVGCGFKIDKTKGAYAYQSDLTAAELDYNKNTYALVIGQLQGALEYAQQVHFEVISCTPDSAMNALVPYRDFSEVFAEEVAKIPAHRTTGLKHPKRQNPSIPTPTTVPSAPAAPRTKKVSILIPTFNRDALLELGLMSIAPQKLANAEKLVLNDGPHSEQTKKIAEAYGATYVHTGVRFNSDSDSMWRVPGYAYNVGAKLATGEILILMCPEMWHMEEDTVERLVRPLLVDMRNIGIPDGKDDDGRFLGALKSDRSHAAANLYGTLKELRTELPFLLAVSRDVYISMGGYDEDFTGRCYDDDDFIDRLKAGGQLFVKTDAHCVHLYHERITLKKDKDHARVEYNKRLYLARKGTVIRNVGREWGVIA